MTEPSQSAPLNESLKLAQQWKDRADDCGLLAKLIIAESATTPNTANEVWEVYNRTMSILLATEADADLYMGQFSPTVGMQKARRHLLRGLKLRNEQR